MTLCGTFGCCLSHFFLLVCLGRCCAASVYFYDSLPNELGLCTNHRPDSPVGGKGRSGSLLALQGLVTQSLAFCPLQQEQTSSCRVACLHDPLCRLLYVGVVPGGAFVTLHFSGHIAAAGEKLLLISSLTLQNCIFAGIFRDLQHLDCHHLGLSSASPSPPALGGAPLLLSAFYLYARVYLHWLKMKCAFFTFFFLNYGGN